MPRKGVPGIDGCLCEIKEKLKALYDRTHACILRINGKTPDGNGDITIDLSDAIPGRYVESVNGQDGNVIIDKASVGLSNVDNVSSSQILNQADANNQSRLEAFEAAKLDPVELEVVANSARIIQLEGQQVVLDDKMEQTIQYVDAIGDDVAEIKDAYVDKTTTQYITGKKYGPTPTSADYSSMWVNKDFVETTDPKRRQNNLVHTVSDESVDGTKTFSSIVQAPHDMVRVVGTGWRQIYTGALNFNHQNIVLMVLPRRIGYGMGILTAGGHQDTKPAINWLAENIPNSHKSDFVITYEEATKMATIWQYGTGNIDGYCTQILAHSWNGTAYTNPWTPSTDNTLYTITESGYTDSQGNMHTFKYYTRSE